MIFKSQIKKEYKDKSSIYFRIQLYRIYIMDIASISKGQNEMMLLYDEGKDGKRERGREDIEIDRLH